MEEIIIKVIIIIESAVIVLISVIVHEAGHYLMAKKFGYNPRFIFHNNKNPTVVHQTCNSRRKFCSIGLSGILSGYIILFILLSQNFYMGDIIDKWLIVLGYTASCYNDIIMIIVKSGGRTFSDNSTRDDLILEEENK
jgi:hypothetical protein